ncbi:CgeB family protein [Roseivivax sediminis]|uniref:Uncharacterized protein n=1 Tax=Roseivivax sediminis TaxID=936889 RepID=A0A1I2CVH4_9RHOB|nr:hypothetical protein [Roseivivax sediminis]SFE72311.1 hypothetical protein SAMN04515678_114103 [Roseivivax sediminis]
MPSHTSQRRILVVMNRFQGYEKSIPAAIEALGHAARFSDARPSNSFMVKALTRLGLLQHIKRISEANTDRLAADARAFGADTLLLISPENLRPPEISRLRTALPGIRIVLYLYDSAANRPLDQQTIDSVDAAFSFDMDDCDRFDQLGFLPLFHHHTAFKAPAVEKTEPAYHYCFIGTGRIRRVKVLAGIARKTRERDERPFFYLYAPSALQYALLRLAAWRFGYTDTLSRESVPFETYLEKLAQSACVVDIEQQNQGGLTIRTMDAVFAGRPFATSNTNIARHDFYPHFPISVFDDERLDISVPTSGDSSQAEQFYHKYHIGTWAAHLLAEEVPDYRLLQSASAPHLHARSA